MNSNLSKFGILLISVIALTCGSFVSGTAQTFAKTKEDSLLNSAAQSLEKGDYAGAEIILQKILASEPRNVAAQTLAGVAADQQNKLSEAEKHFALAAKIAPQSAETRNNYGAILVRLNRKPEAAKEFAASLTANPKQPSALVNLAQIRFAENNFAAARELFEKAASIAPDAGILKALVLISLQLNEKERAAREYKDYSARRSTADATLGELLLSKDLTGEARQELENVLAENADNISAIVLLSRVYAEQKNIPAAGKLLESAVARGLTDAKIYAALAEVYGAAGYPENAIPAMRLAIEKEPNDESWRIRYGLLLIDSNAAAAAAIRIEEAIKDFPKSARLRFLLGMAQFDINKTAEAQKAFESALEIEPQLIPALGYLAATYVDQAKFDDALKIYERAVALDEKNAVLHYLIADTLLKTQNPSPERVENELKRAVALDENLALAHSILGRFYFRQSRLEDARTELERAVKIDPKIADALYQLSLVYARLKMNDESKAALAKFKELNISQEKQENDDRREIVRRLANTKF